MDLFERLELNEQKRKATKEILHNDMEGDKSDEVELDIMVDTTGSFYPDFDSLSSDD